MIAEGETAVAAAGLPLGPPQPLHTPCPSVTLLRGLPLPTGLCKLLIEVLHGHPRRPTPLSVRKGMWKSELLALPGEMEP